MLTSTREGATAEVFSLHGLIVIRLILFSTSVGFIIVFLIVYCD